MRYNSNFFHSKSDEDLGIDLYSEELAVIQPGEIATVGTGTTFEFPVFGTLRRLLTRLIFGVEVTGIGGIVKPRSKHEYDVLAGVIDAGYRGEVKVRIYNTTAETLYIPRGDRFAQMFLVPVFHPPLDIAPEGIDTDSTARGAKGGIHDVR